jgi:hypothetical protein
MNDRLQGVSGEEHGPRREMAAFTTSIDCQRAEGRVPVATNSGAGRTRARAKRRLTRNPVLPKKINQSAIRKRRMRGLPLWQSLGALPM